MLAELDYTEQSSWMLFLKYLDDLERERAVKAELRGASYDFVIDEPHRWSSWAAPKKADGSLDHDNALTGDDLIAFVDDDLFPYLRGFRRRATGPDTLEYKIGEIFGEIENRFRSGYGLRDALELMDSLRFRSQKEKHELSHLYEAKIRNMGNAGRNGGEYYTPRPLIRAMVQVVRPGIGERVYDGAVGSAGFLCEALRLPDAAATSRTDELDDPPDPHLLREGEEVAGLRDRDHEHDPSRHRGAERRPHQHAHREPGRHPGEGPLRRDPGEPALRREGAEGGPAELPHPHRRDGLPLPAALHQVAEGRRAGGGGDQEHLPLQLRQRLSRLREELLRAATSTRCSTARAGPSRGRA